MKILSVDFDGVIHSYTSGWKGADKVSDPPVPGAMKFLRDASAQFDVHIYSSRSKEPDGLTAMRDYIAYCLQDEGLMNEEQANNFVGNVLKWPTQKPAAFLTLDDRAIQFTGTFPGIDTLLAFKTWMQ